MPSLMAKRSSSERCVIRRELHRRRKLAAAPKGGIVKKSSTAASIHKSSADEPAGAATTKPSSMQTTAAASILQHASDAVAAKKQLAAVAKVDGGVAKEIAYVPLAQVAPRRSGLIPTASKMKVSAGKANAGVPKKSTAPPPPSRSLELPAKMPSAATRPRSPSTWVKKGMPVKVRTRAGILPTGHCLVLWLGARVVSDAAADDGFIDVIYDGNFPRDDPLRTVRVAMDDVRSMPAIAES